MLPRWQGLWDRLEDPSRRIVLGFLLKGAFALPLIALARSPAAAAYTILLVNALLCALVAILQRQRPSGTDLTHWDEALWFSAAALAVGFVTEPV